MDDEKLQSRGEGERRWWAEPVQEAEPADEKVHIDSSEDEADLRHLVPDVVDIDKSTPLTNEVAILLVQNLGKYTGLRDAAKVECCLQAILRWCRRLPDSASSIEDLDYDKNPNPWPVVPLLVRADVFSHIHATFKAFPSEHIQSLCCKLVQKLCRNECVREQATDMGLPALVLDALDTHASPQLISRAWKSLHNMTLRTDFSTNHSLHEQIALWDRLYPKAIATLEEYVERRNNVSTVLVRNVLEPLLRCFQTLATFSLVRQQSTKHSKLFASALQQHHKSRTVAQSVLNCMTELSLDEPWEVELMRTGAPYYILRTIREHARTPELQRDAWSTLRNLGFVEGHQVILMKAGLTTDLMYISDLYPDTSNVQSVLWGAFAGFLVNRAGEQRAAASPELLRDAQQLSIRMSRAFRQFPDNPELVRELLFAVSAISSNGSALSLRLCREDLVPHIVHQVIADHENIRGVGMVAAHTLHCMCRDTQDFMSVYSDEESDELVCTVRDATQSALLDELVELTLSYYTNEAPAKQIYLALMRELEQTNFGAANEEDMQAALEALLNKLSQDVPLWPLLKRHAHTHNIVFPASRAKQVVYDRVG